MNEKSRATIAKYAMLGSRDNIVVGLSGGADSVALLHFLLSLRDEFSLEITALHLNHKLRGAESDADESFVKALCKRLGIRLISECADVKDFARGLSLEEAGRRARYEFFERAAAGSNAKIATAHTLSDSAETAVLNFARGTAMRGLCGIPPVRGRIIRPLIECERREIEDYCAENGLEYVSDSSNDGDEFARNRIRHHVIPALLSVNPGFYKALAPNLEALRADAEYLDKLASDALLSAGCGKNRVSREAYLALERPIAFRVLILMLARLEIPADNARLVRLDGIIRKVGGKEQLSAEYYLKSGPEYFTVTKLPRQDAIEKYFCVPVDLSNISECLQIDVFSDKKLRLMNTDCEYCEENIKYTANLLKNTLDCARIYGIAECRQKHDGDKIRLAGRGCTKTLRKLFQEAGIPAALRGKILVLADSRGPVWVEGFGVAERVAVGPDTKKALILEVQNEGEIHA